MAAGKNKFKEPPKVEEDPFEEAPLPPPVKKAAKAKKAKPEKATCSGPNAVVRFVNSERVRKITGLSLLLVAVILSVAFVSFLFTWENDISQLNRPLSEVLFSPDVKVENHLGKIGALLSNQFITRWFGLSAFIFPFLLIVLGIYALTKVKLANISRTFAFSIFFLVWTPVLLGFIFHDKLLFIGGGMGYHINQYLGLILGRIGIGVLLGFSLLVFAVIAYNISFNIPKREKKEDAFVPPVIPVADTENPFKDEPRRNTMQGPGFEPDDDLTDEEKNDPRLFDFVVKENEPVKNDIPLTVPTPTPPPVVGPELELNNFEEVDDTPFTAEQPKGDLEIVKH